MKRKTPSRNMYNINISMAMKVTSFQFSLCDSKHKLLSSLFFMYNMECSFKLDDCLVMYFNCIEMFEFNIGKFNWEYCHRVENYETEKKSLGIQFELGFCIEIGKLIANPE